MTLPSRAELMRRRRCRLLAVGMVLGALLPVFQWSWITLAIGLGGVAAAPARLPARMYGLFRAGFDTERHTLARS